MKMKIRKVLFACLAVVAVAGLATASGCSKASSTTTTKNQSYTVKTGTITNEITGTGNLAFSKSEDLAFEMAGYVEAVLVSAGETVTKGQELAQLDTTEWDKSVKTLKAAVTQAQRALATAENGIAAKKLAVTSAELSVRSANDSMEQIASVKRIQDQIDNAQSSINIAKLVLTGQMGGGVQADYTYWNDVLTAATTALAQYNQDMADLLDGSANVSNDVALAVSKAELAVKQAESNLADANKAIADAQATIDDDKQALADAQANLDAANEKNPIITAPFDGFITRVNVSGGDEVAKGTVAMQIADPSQFEVSVQVNEDDIFSVAIGSDASITLDAVSGLTYPARISFLAPLATVSQGVVSYEVTVELTSTNGTSTSTAFSAMPPAMSMNGTAPGMPLGQSMNGTPSFTMPSGNQSAMPPQAIAPAVKSVTLKAGLSAVVNIVTSKAADVIVVPSRALTTQGPITTVQVIDSSGLAETRIVRTGLSDDSNTQITSGLNAGETIQYTLTSSSSSKTTTTRASTLQGLGQIGGGGPPPGGF